MIFSQWHFWLWKWIKLLSSKKFKVTKNLGIFWLEMQLIEHSSFSRKRWFRFIRLGDMSIWNSMLRVMRTENNVTNWSIQIGYIIFNSISNYFRLWWNRPVGSQIIFNSSSKLAFWIDGSSLVWACMWQLARPVKIFNIFTKASFIKKLKQKCSCKTAAHAEMENLTLFSMDVLVNV